MASKKEECEGNVIKEIPTKKERQKQTRGKIREEKPYKEKGK